MYKEVVQNENGELIARYPVVDHDGNVEFDFDGINEYSIYPFESTGAYIVEHLPTGYVLGTYTTVSEACEAIKTKLNDFKKLHNTIEKERTKFEAMQKANSLEERYKDKGRGEPIKVKKEVSPYLASLQQKAKEMKKLVRIRTEEMHAQVEQWRSERNRKLGNQEYIDALINH